MAPIALLVLAYGAWQTVQPLPGVVYQERSFFGVLRVKEPSGQRSPQRQLVNGTTLHGVQFTGEKVRRIPTSYFGRATGIGLALSGRASDGALRMGIIGLGAGTLAAYGREGDVFRFYEIDPAVGRIAKDEGFFSYLEDAPARVDVVFGDARLLLAKEQAQGASQGFDFLVVDAFTSDSIPVHLLTREAFIHYVDALAPDGVLAIHASNRHFHLMQLVARMGFDAGLSNLLVVTEIVPRLQSQAARWVLLTRDPGRLVRMRASLQRRHRELRLAATSIKMESLDGGQLKDVPVWTDDYSDLFSLLR